MPFTDDIYREIICRLPLNNVVQCKLVSSHMKNMISHSDFVKILFKRHKDTSTQLIYTRMDVSQWKKFHKISLDPITQLMTILPHEVEILGSCNGLIFIDFERVRRFCIFNPITRDYQLIAYAEGPAYSAERTGLAVDYPNSDQYKLVAISYLVDNSNFFYIFHILSSQQPGLWRRDIRLRVTAFLSLPVGCDPVYWDGSLHWLRADGSVIAFDTRTEAAILIDRPEFLDHYDHTYGKITIGQDIWLGTAQGVLTLVFIYRRYIVTAIYNKASSRWRASYPMDNVMVQENIVNDVRAWILNGFPLWIDSKPVSFLVQHHLTLNYDLYQYDTNMHVYENVGVLRRANFPMYCFHPTLASVHRTPFINVTEEGLEHIAENLDNIRRFIIEGIVMEASSSEEESSSSSSGGEGQEEVEAGGEEAEEAGGEEEVEAGGEEAEEAGGEEADEAGGEEEIMY